MINVKSTVEVSKMQLAGKIAGGALQLAGEKNRSRYDNKRA